MRWVWPTLAAVAALALAGCAGIDVSKVTGNYSPQDYAGCTMVEYRAVDGTAVDWRDCKDKSLVRTGLTMPSGLNFTYDADDVSGLEQMKLRADVARALSDNNLEVTDAVVNSIIRALGARSGIP